MADLSPLLFVWEGDGFKPSSSYFAKRCDERFVIGEKYMLVEHLERSSQSHNHFFASVADTWSNLPDDLAVQFATPDILRKHALIMTGFRRERKFIASSKAEARKIAAFLRPQSVRDDYAFISVNDCVVIEWKAKSQSYREMGKEDFQRSKQAVIDFLAELIGVTTETLSANAGQAA